MPSVEEYIDTLKRLTATLSDTELAARLGLAKQTISAWRRRKSIPTKQERMLVEILGPEAAFSSLVQYYYSEREQRILAAVFLELYEADRDRLRIGSSKFSALKWSGMFAAIQEELRQRMRMAGLSELPKEPSGGFYWLNQDDAVVRYLLALIAAGQIESYKNSHLVLVSDGDYILPDLPIDD